MSKKKQPKQKQSSNKKYKLLSMCIYEHILNSLSRGKIYGHRNNVLHEVLLSFSYLRMYNISYISYQYMSGSYLKCLMFTFCCSISLDFRTLKYCDVNLISGMCIIVISVFSWTVVLLLFVYY